MPDPIDNLRVSNTVGTVVIEIQLLGGTKRYYRLSEAQLVSLAKDMRRVVKNNKRQLEDIFPELF